ncbi:MAG: hypothetical protein ACXW1M_06145 [Acidimicrobiia bacterium]
MRTRPTPAEWVMVGAGSVVVVASFLPWYRLPVSVLLDGTSPRTSSAWSRGFAPTTLLPVVFALAVALPIVLARLADLHLPKRIAGMQCAQLRTVLAVGAALLALTEVATNRMYGPVSLARGPGLWLTLLGSFTLLAGALIDRKAATQAVHPDTARPDRSEA